MAATVAMVRRIAGELAPVSSTDIEAFLADAALEVSIDAWGDLYDRAHALIASHLAAIAHPELAAPAGPIQSETVGAVSRAYAVAPIAARSSPFATTRFGLEYLRLLRQTGPAMRVV